MEDKLAGLERANFDLKMRIYYLNNKLQEAEQGGYLEDSAEKVVNLLQQRDSTAEKLKEDNVAANRRISELETELNLLKTKLEANLKTRDVSLTKARDSSVLQMEENLKRERQAALAVAQHDSSVIIQLEAEIKKLSERHDSDLLLISEASEKCAKLMTTIGEKGRDVERKAEALTASKQQNEALQEKIKSQDLLINELNNRLQASFEQRRGENAPTRSHFQGSISGFPSPNRAMPPPAGIMGNNSSVHQNNWTPGVGGGRPMADFNSSVGDATTASPKPAPKLGAPHMSMSTSHLSAPTSAIGESASMFSSGGYSTAPRGVEPSSDMHSYHRSLRDKYFESQSVLGVDPPNLHQPAPNGQTAETIRMEILQVRSENDSLKKQLETERAAIGNLQSVLDNVRTAAEEITLLEAEEIARLEAEVENMQKEKSRLVQTIKKNQDTIEELRVKVFQLETDLNEIQLTKSQGVYRNNGDLSRSRRPSPDRQSRGGSSGGVARGNSVDFGDGHNARRGGDGAAHAFGGHGEKFVPSPNLPTKSGSRDSQPQQAVVDMYRQREAELLEALEAVINRCQELEKAR